MKNNKKKGFTLMELLIVIAIIVVLVAIAIPVFGGQLTKAKETTDVANIRSAYAEAQTLLATGGTLSDARDKMAGVTLNIADNYTCPDSVTGTSFNVTYQGTKIDGNGTATGTGKKPFTWKLSTASDN